MPAERLSMRQIRDVLLEFAVHRHSKRCSVTLIAGG